jgi:dTDP-4-dehydrorhamnose reductase
VERLLVTGASGFLGWQVIQKLKQDWEIVGTSYTRSLKLSDLSIIQVNLTNFTELKNLFDEVQPDAVIHTAAAADPNYCEENQAETFQINTEVPLNIAGLCSEQNIPCVFTSSDLVFDGLNPPYSEKDAPSPICEYGEQKLQAELGMKERHPKTIICRMALLFGEPGPAEAGSFIQPLIHAIKAGGAIKLFIDEYRTPLSGRFAAEGLKIALERQPSVLHLGGLERMSRYEFGLLLAALLGIKGARLSPCRQKDLDMPAPRPPDVSLDCTRAIALGFYPASITNELKYLLPKLWDNCGCAQS